MEYYKLGQYEGIIFKDGCAFYFKPIEGLDKMNVYFGGKNRFDLQEQALGYRDKETARCSPECRTKSDAIKFINFLNNKYPMGTTNVRILKPQGGQRIINSACNNWKSELAENWGQAIVLGKDIEVSEEYYKKMRGACTAEQHKIFDEEFGPTYNFKEGENIIVRTGTDTRIRKFSHIEGGKFMCFNLHNNFTSPWDHAISAEGITLP